METEDSNARRRHSRRERTPLLLKKKITHDRRSLTVETKTGFSLQYPENRPHKKEGKSVGKIIAISDDGK